MNQVKMLRGQLRQIVKEMLPDILSNSLKSEIFKTLQIDIMSRLTKIESDITLSLEKLDQRQKDSLGYLIRQTTTNISTPSEEVVKSELPNEQS